MLVYTKTVHKNTTFEFSDTQKCQLATVVIWVFFQCSISVASCTISVR